MDMLRRSFSRAENAADLEFDSPTFPLSQNSAELHSLLAGWVTVSPNGLPYVDETRAFSIPAFARGVELIAGTIAGLPLRTYAGTKAQREASASVFDDPTGPAEISPFQWMETVFVHLVAYREAYLQELRNDGGGVIGYWPIHPSAVTKVEWAGLSKRYTVHFTDGDRVLGTPSEPTEYGAVLQIMGPGPGGLRGTPLWEQYRAIFQTALAAQDATARVFTGPTVRGLVSLDGEEELGDDPDAEAQQIMEQLNAKVAGVNNAGQLAFVNRHLKFQSWMMTNVDAEYSANRVLTLEEFARMTGVPPHLLAMIDKQTSWGTGVAEQNIGLARYTLMRWTSAFESAVNTVLPRDTFVEFDYKGLFAGTPAQELELLLAQTGNAPLLSQDEARAILNRGPMPKTEVPDAAQES